jgi:hypothetical protein
VTRLIPLAFAAGMLGLSACSDEPGQASPPTGDVAPVAAGGPALAFGMTREHLEEARLWSPDGVDLGDVETLILDRRGRLTHLVVELRGPGDPKVQVPLGDVISVQQDGEQRLATDLTPAQLQALPAWTPPQVPAA